MHTDPARIAILVYPESTASVIYGMQDLFHSAGRDWGVITEGIPGRCRIEPLIVTRSGTPLEVGNGVVVMPKHTLENCPAVDVICIPEIDLPPGTPLKERFGEELSWLRERYKQGTILASACSGAMLFAEAGLLNGFEATTHWAWCDVMKHRFPDISVNGQRALVVSGDQQRLVMAGGGTTWMDLALYLIARTVSVETAMQVARINLIDWHHVGQQPFARLASTRQVDDATVNHCQSWIAEHYQKTNPVTAMIRLSGLSERTFKRRFKLATGMAPLEYVHALRLEEAKQLLESSTMPIEEVASEVGYEDAGFFSRLFRRKVNLTPAQYRKRFGILRESLAANT